MLSLQVVENGANGARACSEGAIEEVFGPVSMYRTEPNEEVLPAAIPSEKGSPQHMGNSRSNTNHHLTSHGRSKAPHGANISCSSVMHSAELGIGPPKDMFDRGGVFVAF